MKGFVLSASIHAAKAFMVALAIAKDFCSTNNALYAVELSLMPCVRFPNASERVLIPPAIS